MAINQNFDVAAGVVNGSQGILKKVRYFEDEEGRRHLKSCVVEIKDSDAVEMPHLPKHHFSIRLSSSSSMEDCISDVRSSANRCRLSPGLR